MSNPINISTSDFIEYREAVIDGVEFKVRKIGAGQQLDLSRISQGIFKLQAELVNTQAKVKSGSEGQESALKSINKLVEKLTKQTSEMAKVYAKSFDDGGDGSKSLELVEKVGLDNITKIIERVFEG
ncbi:hypothetical protein [Sharpea azabuensis]